MSVIEQLKGLPPQARAQFMAQRFEKNRAFFRKKHPSIERILQHYSSDPFSINVTSDFITIVNKETGELCHPEAGLDKFSTALGDWTHKAWNDFVDLPFRLYEDDSRSSQQIMQFTRHIFNQFSDSNRRIEQGQINLPVLPEERRFANSTVFLGIFHGLHIDSYLAKTVVNNVALIEPDPNRFVVSCGFLDYEQLEQRFNGLVLYVGGDFPQKHLDVFFDKARVTGAVWTRVLAGYDSPLFKAMVDKLRLQWLKFSQNFYPSSSMIEETVNGLKNMTRGEKVLSNAKKLSPNATILVVGSGPSLSEDIDWIKQHQQQMIIFAAHSVTRLLAEHEITPDFQFSIEAKDWPERTVSLLKLSPDVPIVLPYKNSLQNFEAFADKYLFAEVGAGNLVNIRHALQYTHPTTGNLATAVACYFKPKHLILAGLDFGFVRVEQTHASGTLYDDVEGFQEGQSGQEQVPVPANFPGMRVFSSGQFNTARVEVERALKQLSKATKVYNFSAGALVEGATPCRSADFKIKGSYDKRPDVQAIHNSFSPCKKGKHWTHYKKSPLHALQELVAYAKELFAPQQFDWERFTRQADQMFIESVKICREKGDNSYSVDAWYDWIEILLRQFYRFLILTNSAEEAQAVYSLGRSFMLPWLEEIAWPDEAVEFLATD